MLRWFQLIIKTDTHIERGKLQQYAKKQRFEIKFSYTFLQTT